MRKVIKRYIENAKNSEDLINIACELEENIKLIGEKYITININNTDDIVERDLLLVEFEERLNAILMCNL